MLAFVSIWLHLPVALIIELTEIFHTYFQAYGTSSIAGKNSLIFRLPTDVLRTVREMLYSLEKVKSQYAQVMGSNEESSDSEDEFADYVNVQFWCKNCLLFRKESVT